MLNRVYRTWVPGAKIYICALTKKDAYFKAKEISGWKTSHVIVREKNMRTTCEGIILEVCEDPQLDLI